MSITTDLQADYTNAGPLPLTIEILGLNAASPSTYIDVSNYVPTESVTLTRDGRTLRAMATFNIRRYDATSRAWALPVNNNEVHITDRTPDPTGSGAAPYNRMFMGYVSRVTSTIEATDGGIDTTWTVECVDVGILLDLPVRQITTQWPPNDGTPVVATTVVSAKSAGAVTVTPVSMAGLYTTRKVLAYNADTSNFERITIGTTTSTTFQTTLTYSKSANWVVIGGISDYDTIAGGFKLQDPTSGTYTAYPGLLDEYYNNQGFTVLTTSVEERILSLQHRKYETTTHRKVLTDLAQQAGGTTINVLANGTPSAGTVTVTPTGGAGSTNMVGLYVGKILTAQNAGGTHSETVQILPSGFTGTAFQVTLTSSKSAGWILTGAVTINAAMTWNVDNAAHTALWTPTLIWADAFDGAKRTDIEFVDTATISASQAHYASYTREIDNTRRISKVTVLGNNNALGSYEDTATKTALGGHTWEAEPITDTNITTNADAVTRATTYVNGFKRSSETLTNVVTYNQMATSTLRGASLFMQGGRTVRFTNASEGGTPATYAVARYQLAYPSGMPTHTFELGDTLEALGDKPVPLFGSRDFLDRTPPPVPTWDTTGGPPPNWMLSTTYDPSPNKSQMHVQWQISNASDLYYYWLKWSTDGGVTYTHARPIFAPDHDYTVTELTPGTTIYFKVSAIDDNGNSSGDSAIVSYACADITVPNHPTGFSVTSSYLSENGRRGNIRIGWTKGAADPTHNGDDGGGYDVRCIYTTVPAIRQIDHADSGATTAVLHNFIVNAAFTIEIQQIDQWGRRSTWQAASNSPYTVGAVPNNALYDGNFTVLSPFDPTQPDGWTVGTGGGGTAAIDTTTPLAGGNSLKFICGGGQAAAITSELIAVPNTTNTEVNVLASIAMSLIYKALNANGTLSVAAQWYSDTTGVTSVGTTTYFNHAPTAGVHPIYTKQGISSYLPPAGAITGRLFITFTGSVSTNSVWIAGVRFGVAANASSLAPIGAYAIGTDPVTGDTGSITVNDGSDNPRIVLDANGQTLKFKDASGSDLINADANTGLIQLTKVGAITPKIQAGNTTLNAQKGVQFSAWDGSTGTANQQEYYDAGGAHLIMTEAGVDDGAGHLSVLDDGHGIVSGVNVNRKIDMSGDITLQSRGSAADAGIHFIAEHGTDVAIYGSGGSEDAFSINGANTSGDALAASGFGTGGKDLRVTTNGDVVVGHAVRGASSPAGMLWVPLLDDATSSAPLENVANGPISAAVGVTETTGKVLVYWNGNWYPLGDPLGSISPLMHIDTVTVDTLLDATFFVVLIDTNGGNVTVTLPDARSATPGTQYYIKWTTGANTAAVDSNSASIDGAAIYTFASAYDAIHIVLDGATTIWQVLSNNP